MPHFGFLRVATASPDLRVADCRFNTERMIEQMHEAESIGTELVVFPEMGITGYTCGDLFHHETLLNAAWNALLVLRDATLNVFSGVYIVGLPVRVDGMVFNCAAVLKGGTILGIVPKSYLPNYKEFYDARYYSPASCALSNTIERNQETFPFGTDLLFRCENQPAFVLGVEICEDLWQPIPPSALQVIAGATVIANLSASNETIGKASYRKQLVQSQSGRCIAGYVYSSSGPAESTTDLVFGGHGIIAENGTLLAETPRFQRGGTLGAVDLDLDRLQRDRTQQNSFNDSRRDPALRKIFRTIPFSLTDVPREPTLIRIVDAHPFVPAEASTLKERCEEIFATQVCALAKRLDHIGRPSVSIGVSGGLDSTLALLVACKTFDALGEPRGKIQTLTMPGFGTTSRTKANAISLMKQLGTTSREIDIRPLCLEEMRALGHQPFGIPLGTHTPDSLTAILVNLPEERRHDLTFENIQARMRTNLLMNTGFVIGTGDLSELALGWCTYNADHMSMYNPNISIPKTLVKFLVSWAAENEFDGKVRDTLLDVVETKISPELLPTAADGSIAQSTESTLGPYELHDFFLYHFLRWGCLPEKLLFLAGQATFHAAYSPSEIRQWLKLFVKRFFANQFKRSCLPDGPKVGSVSLSPRGDWRMPSDAVAEAWLRACE